MLHRPVEVAGVEQPFRISLMGSDERPLTAQQQWDGLLLPLTASKCQTGEAYFQ